MALLALYIVCLFTVCLFTVCMLTFRKGHLVLGDRRHRPPFALAHRRYPARQTRFEVRCR
jgi:hypothetical protein